MLGQYYKEKLNLTNKTAFKENDKASLSVFISQSSFIFVITNQNFGVIHQLCQIELINLPGGGNLTEKIGFLINNYQKNLKRSLFLFSAKILPLFLNLIRMRSKLRSF